ncbi:two-component response regulator ORR24-like [Phragmites australis]|uniref:two-component response regulator ORR24-like n=1 Tax=Phragmites australis TaxID=29695 RepID=UPI002D78EB80|nr:two-component response regulator ORR24-like [Phragmites australis]
MDVDKFLAGLRVLAVDDDRVCLKLLEKQLQHCKYDVTTTTHAETALEMLRARKDADQFDLVISDVHMPDMDGFKLLEFIGLEMDIPVIMLSANEEMETMMKGIKHGACDYFVKPVRLEQLRIIWMHVVKRSKNDPRNRISGDDDDAGHKHQSGDVESEEDGANGTRKYSRKKKKDGDGPEEDRENTYSSTQKRRRIQWSGQLHHKFVEVVNQIGVDRAVPKKILEMMNVDGINRENVSSHLQKYRLGLKKLRLGTYRSSNPSADEPGTWRRDWNPAYINMNGLDGFKHHSEHGIHCPSASFAGSSNSSSKPFARMNSPSAFGTHGLFPSQSVQLMSSQRNLGVPLKDMGPAGHGGNLLKDAVQDASNFISSGNSYANISNGGLSGASTCFPSGPSGSSFADIPDCMVLGASKSFPSGTSGNSFANISNGGTPLAAASIGFHSSHSGRSYASILRGKMLGANRGIPFDSDDSFENIGNGEMLAPQFAGLSSSSNSWKTVVPREFPDLAHKVVTSRGPSQGNSLKVSQLSRLAATSGQMPTSGNEFQNKMAALMRKSAPVAGFGEQVAPLNLGSNTNSTAMPNDSSALGSASSNRYALPDHQIDNFDMQTQMLNGRIASGNLPEKDGTVDQQAVGDQLNSNGSLMGTSGFFDDWLDQDFLKYGDAFMDGDWESIK